MDRYERFRKFFVGAGWLYFCFMAYMLLHPRPPVPPMIRLSFSIVHFLAFTALGGVVALARKKTSSFYWFGILFVWCAGSEFLQRYTGRCFEVVDIVQNTLGISIGLPVGGVVRRFLTRRLASGETETAEKVGEGE